MADYSPATKVRVLKDVPCDDTYTDVRWFDNTGAQQSFFEGFVKHSYDNATYQRVNSSVASPRGPLSMRIPVVADEVYDCNYLMFQNQPYGDKWFYAFIRRVNYVNPNNTEIIYEIDYFQTFMCDIEIHPCMVLREHYSAAEDEAFANTVPEPFVIPNYTIDTDATKDWAMGRSMSGYVNVAIIPNTLCVAIIQGSGFPIVNMGSLYNGIYSGAWILSAPALSAPALIMALITALAAVDCAEQICDIYMTPSPPSMSNSADQEQFDTGIQTTNLNYNVAGGTYTIRNKKILSYPYTYIEGVSRSGGTEVYKPELIGEGSFKGTINSICLNEFAAIFRPEYEDKQGVDAHTLTFTCGVHCTWAGQMYADAFVANTARIALNALAGAVGGGGVVSGSISAPGGNAPALMNSQPSASFSAASAGAGVASSLIQDTASNIYNSIFDAPVPHYYSGSSDYLLYATKTMGFTFYRKCPTYETLERLDNFFDLYGYACNKMKMPNLKTRQYWNYVQLQKPCITGSVPVEGMAIIKAAFARGVRLWHVDNVGEYTGSNPAT